MNLEVKFIYHIIFADNLRVLQNRVNEYIQSQRRTSKITLLPIFTSIEGDFDGEKTHYNQPVLVERD